LDPFLPVPPAPNWATLRTSFQHRGIRRTVKIQTTGVHEEKSNNTCPSRMLALASPPPPDGPGVLGHRLCVPFYALAAAAAPERRKRYFL
jgi:hypothetical protein